MICLYHREVNSSQQQKVTFASLAWIQYIITGAAKQVEMTKTSERIHGCIEEGEGR